ncbi:MAG TPA: hypothetical protein VJH24_05045 [Candidatus Bilamarchaeaceae archaeon]|nr:hypothetical protein [Candidatus Bilamarchaeaceae archaeon]
MAQVIQSPVKHPVVHLRVDGFKPLAEPPAKFDIAAAHKRVAGYLAERGFRVEQCPDYRLGRTYVDEGMGIPTNTCQFDARANLEDPGQRRTAFGLGILVDRQKFRGNLTLTVTDGDQERRIELDDGAADTAAYLAFLKVLDGAGEVEVTYQYRNAHTGSFSL